MKMKKCLGLGLSALAILGMVGCSSKDNLNEDSKDTDIPKNNISQNENKNNEESDDVTFLGKVKNIVGNEIELELAKDQDVSGKGSKLPEGVQFQESIGGDSGSIPEGSQSLTESSGEVISQDSISIDSSEGGEIFQIGDPVDNEKLELEYIGETIKITIPTGVNIFDMRSGSDSKLSAIKANSIIKVSAKGTKESPIVQSVDIVE